MEQLIEYLMTTEYAAYVGALCLVCRIFLMVAPEKLTEKIPDAVMVAINVCALSVNKAVDIKGNRR